MTGAAKNSTSNKQVQINRSPKNKIKMLQNKQEIIKACSSADKKILISINISDESKKIKKIKSNKYSTAKSAKKDSNATWPISHISTAHNTIGNQACP